MCLDMSDYVGARGGGGEAVDKCVLFVHVHIFVSIGMFLLASLQICMTCGIMHIHTHVHTCRGKWGPVHAEKQLLSISHTHKHFHTLSVVNGIKQLGDNGPDGQTRNQASIRLPASSSPYPFNHSISLAHTHRHLLHTWDYNYIFSSPYSSKAIITVAISSANKSNPQETLDCQAQQIPPKS